MKARLFPLLVALLLGAVSPARAELVHLSFSDWDGQFLWRADSGLVEWNHAIGTIPRLEIYYDPATATPIAPGSNTYRLGDVASNFWRFTVTGPEAGVKFTVSRPLESINYTDLGDGRSELSFEHYTVTPEYGALTFFTRFRTPDFTDSLPSPPADFDESSIYSISGDSDWFPYPRMGEGYGYGRFDSSTAEVVPLTPVPEPGVYGLAGAGMILMVLLRGRWRGRAGIAI